MTESASLLCTVGAVEVDWEASIDGSVSTSAAVTATGSGSVSPSTTSGVLAGSEDVGGLLSLLPNPKPAPSVAVEAY